MKLYGTVFGVLCVVLVSRCDDPHHIINRNLENQNSSEITLMQEDVEINKTDDSLITNDTKLLPTSGNSSATSLPLDTSEKLEQELDKLGKPRLPANIYDQTNQTADQLLIGPSKSLNDTLDKFNVSSTKKNSTTTVVKNSEHIGVVPFDTILNITQAPKQFPNGTSLNNLTIYHGNEENIQAMQNSTAEKDKKLTNIGSKNQTAIDTETEDLLNRTIHEEVAVAEHQHPLEPQEPEQIPEAANYEAELIENGENTEDKRNPKKSDLKLADDDSGSQQRYMAALIVSSLVAVSVICYGALLVWRRYLENRYGSRTMLVNEEDFDDPNDMRHFSVSSPPPRIQNSIL